MIALFAILGLEDIAPAAPAPEVPEAEKAPAEPALAGPAREVVFIHGLYLNAESWGPWRTWFERQGWRTHAPEWPGHAGAPAELRAAPPAELESLTFEQVVALNADYVRSLPTSPLLVGHSMGGLIVQLLLQQGLGAAGVAIDSAPPKGLTSLSHSFFKSNLPSLVGKGPIVLDADQFHYAFTNHLEEEAAQPLYEAWAVPEARDVAKGPLSEAAEVDWAKERPPLLLVAGGDDHIIPPGLNERNAKKYADSPSVTEFRLYPGRTHWTCAQEGWEAIATDSLAWFEAL